MSRAAGGGGAAARLPGRRSMPVRRRRAPVLVGLPPPRPALPCLRRLGGCVCAQRYVRLLKVRGLCVFFLGAPPGNRGRRREGVDGMQSGRIDSEMKEKRGRKCCQLVTEENSNPGIKWETKVKGIERREGMRCFRKKENDREREREREREGERGGSCRVQSPDVAAARGSVGSASYRSDGPSGWFTAAAVGW